MTAALRISSSVFFQTPPLRIILPMAPGPQFEAKEITLPTLTAMNRKSAADEYEIVEVAKKKQAEQSAAIPSKRGSDEHVGHRKERTESGMEIKDTRVKYYADESHKELPLYRDQELISPPAVDERVAHRQEGLSSKKCCKVIVEEAKAVLNEFQQQQFNQQHWHTYLRQPWAWLGFLISTLLFLFYILIVFRAGLQWSGRTGIIVEGLFIGAVTAWNIWLLWRENRFARREIIQRIQLIIGRLEKNGLNAIQVCKHIDTCIPLY